MQSRNISTSSSSISRCGVTKSKNGIIACAILFLPLFHSVQKPQNLGRISGHHAMGRNILGDHAAGAYHGVLADDHLRQDGGPGADGSAFLDPRGLYLPVRFGLQLAVAGGGPRIGVVDEGYAVSDEDVVFNLDSFANESVAGNLAVLADTGIFLDFHEGSDLGVGADRAAVQIDELG